MSQRGREALERLLDGNRRYVEDRPRRPHTHAERRRELARGQHPFAALLCCSDSRVAPEIIFDQGLGELFVVRVAGNVTDDEAILASLEYAVGILHVPLVMVMGHQNCGAVQASLADADATPAIRGLARAIRPAVRAVSDADGDALDAAVRENARRVAARLRDAEPLLRARVEAGELLVVAAYKSLETGEVRVLE